MINSKEFYKVVEALMNGADPEQFTDFECDGYILNRNFDLVRTIVKGLIAKDHYCPCRIPKIEDNLCVCLDFRKNEHCCCKLWVKKENENEQI